MPVSVSIEKSPVPIIWIDTSIIFLITQYKMGVNLQDVQRRRAKLLYESILRETRRGKLICPLADQDEEIWIDRKECLSTIHELSLGITTDSMISVNKKLFELFAKSFLSQREEVTLEYSIPFLEDPIEELNDALERPIFVSIDPPLVGGANATKARKGNLLKYLDKKREENNKAKVTYEEQRELEYMAEFEVIQTVINYPRDLIELGLSEEEVFWNKMNAVEILNKWQEVTANYQNNQASLIDYYKSDHYRQIPTKKISVEFFSKLMTDKQPIRSGDIKDVEHVSTMLPFVDMLITDKQRKTQLLKLSYDAEYQTKICYVGDEKEISSFFESL